MSVLLVDDEPGIRDGLAAWLRLKGVEAPVRIFQPVSFNRGHASSFKGKQVLGIVPSRGALPSTVAATLEERRRDSLFKSMHPDGDQRSSGSIAS